MAPTKHICSRDVEITTLTINQENMAENIKEIKDDIKAIKEFLFEGKLDEKYASKTTEKIVYSLVGIILTAFIVAVTSLVWVK